MQNKKFLFFLFFLSLFVRSLIFYCFLSKDKNYWNYDTVAYNRIAMQIVSGNGITNIDGSPHFYRVPGYSLFLAGCYKLFGDDIKNALWVQVFLASFIPLLIFFLCLVLFPSSLFLAKLCSIYSVFHLGFVLFSGLAMTETFFVLFFLIFLILFISSFDLFFCKKLKHKYYNSRLFFSGLFLGIASMLRPVGHYVLFLSLLFLLFSSFKFWQRIKKSFLFFSGWFLIVCWLLIRNFLFTGHIFFHTLPGVHFLKHSAARVVMGTENSSYDGALKSLNDKVVEFEREKEKVLGRKLHEIEFCILAEKVSFDCMKKNIFATFKHAFGNMFKTCFSLYSAELMYIDSAGKLPAYDKNRSWLDILKRFVFPQVSNKFLVGVIYLEILLFLFLLIGFVCFIFKNLFIRDGLCLLFKVFPFIGLFVFLSLSCGFARLRLPVESFLIILSLRFWLDFLKTKV